MLSIGSIVWGVTDIPRGIEFWTTALDYRLARDPDVDWAMLVPREGEGQQLALALVHDPAGERRRHHLDLYADDQSAEVQRLVAAGATTVDDWNYPDDADYVVLEDPDGNRFCVVQK